MATRTSEREPAAAGTIGALPEDDALPDDGALPEQMRPQSPNECKMWLYGLFPQFNFYTTLSSANPTDPKLDADKAEILRGILEQIGAEQLHAAGLQTVEIWNGIAEKDRAEPGMFWYSLTATRAQNLAALCAAYDIPEPEAHADERPTHVVDVGPAQDEELEAIYTRRDGKLFDAKSEPMRAEKPAATIGNTRRAIRKLLLGAGILGAGVLVFGAGAGIWKLYKKTRETERPAAAVAAAPSQTPTPSLQITHDCRVRVARLSSRQKGFRASCDMTREQGITPDFEWTGPEQTAKDGTKTQPGRITIKVPDMVTGELKEVCVTTDPIPVVKKPETDVGGIQEFPGTKFTCGKAPQ